MSDDLRNTSNHPPSGSSGFAGRLATYLFGVAIGLLILGWFVKKHAAQQRDQQETTPDTSNTTQPHSDPSP